ncbi:MAG: hypothetical protein E6G85_02970 [Alphaproteobacteria bacterium]|nr:MAG: hypothetical protein E6G85_02970 [Alphaproteobacteria bacterium]
MGTTAVAVALFAAMIAFGQWWTARQKLVLDLFEKRFAIFMDLRRLVSEAIQLGKVSQPGSINEVIARSQFLFGSDVNEHLRELHRLFNELEVGRPSAPQEILEKFEKMTPGPRIARLQIGSHQFSALPVLPN